MKLVVIIPCYNEEKTLPLVLQTIPKKINGIHSIEIVVIDDGSTDNSVKIAKESGVRHFVLHPRNQGLAKSFEDGLDKALALGADIIVNTDGDNQYPQQDIPRLIDTILQNKADIVIADRQTNKIKHFSTDKKILQYMGTFAVNVFAGTHIGDAASGFRAYSREAAMHLNIFTDYTYTIETIIQASKKKMRIESIKIQINPTTRKSRLITNLFSYIKKSATTILRLFAIYEPLKIFTYVSFIVSIPGFIITIRALYFILTTNNGGHLQSLLIGSFLILIGFQIFLIGIIADLTSINRKKLENMLYRQKKMEFNKMK